MLYFCVLSNVYVAYAMCILQKSQNLYFFNAFPNKVFIIKLKILIFSIFHHKPQRVQRSIFELIMKYVLIGVVSN